MRTRTVPACWTWVKPAEVHLEKHIQRHERKYGTPPRADRVRWWVMTDWHRGRCAVCSSSQKRTVYDHDHETNLFRGFLCPSCNTQESYGGGILFDRYRERHPAIMFNIKRRQYDPLQVLLGPRYMESPPHYG